MANIKDTLSAAMQIQGAAGVALMDLKTGMTLGIAGEVPDLDVEAATNADILKAKTRGLMALGSRDSVEDVVFTLGQRYQVIRLVGGHQHLMLYLSLRRAATNLALARHRLSVIEEDLVV